MKKTILFIAATICLALTSCNNANKQSAENGGDEQSCDMTVEAFVNEMNNDYPQQPADGMTMTSVKTIDKNVVYEMLIDENVHGSLGDWTQEMWAECREDFLIGLTDGDGYLDFANLCKKEGYTTVLRFVGNSTGYTQDITYNADEIISCIKQANR
ncbi:MAG: hypothetical protein K5867_10300 [Bacteroidales bacterium]|nr:hypothetical protein [Bacteroidales bacterium]